MTDTRQRSADKESRSGATTAEVGVMPARTQWQLFRRKFLRHKLAMGSLAVLALITLSAVFADYVAPYDFNDINVTMRDTGPTLEDQHYFGTDRLGRDYFSRVLYGTRTSLQVGWIVGILATTLGTLIGALAGYYRGWVEAVLMRATDMLLVLPQLAILLVLAVVWGGGNPIRIGLILAVLGWATLARVVRSTFLSLREKEFVEAARAAGASDLRIMFRHMLPNSAGVILVNMTLTIGVAIIIESTLAFLGFGVQPPTPALGLLIDEGRGAMQTSWWLITMPIIWLVAIVLCVNFIGDGLRDALDPTQKETT